MLRQFLWERREQPLQVVRRDAALPWIEEDWRHLPAAERKSGSPPPARRPRPRPRPRQGAAHWVAVLRLEDDVYRFVWSFHHIVCDGWSVGLLLSEALTTYLAARDGEPLELPPARKYRDYITWIQSRGAEGAEAYWRRTLRGYTAAVPLPFDGTGSGGDPEGWLARDEVLSLPDGFTEELRAFARRHQLTVNTVVQGARGLPPSLAGTPGRRLRQHRLGRPPEIEGSSRWSACSSTSCRCGSTPGPSGRHPLSPRLDQQAEQRELGRARSADPRLEQWGGRDPVRDRRPVRELRPLAQRVGRTSL